MSLYVYDKLDVDNGTFTAPVIKNISEYFDSILLKDDEVVRDILKSIDHVSYKDEKKCISNFLEGGEFSKSLLSDGCKTALLVYMFPDTCFCVASCGNNALIKILQLGNGIVYLEPRFISDIKSKKCDIVYKGIKFNYLKQFFNWRADNDYGIKVYERYKS